MTVKKLNFIFIFALLFCACSVDNTIENDTDTEAVIEINSNRAGGNCILPHTVLFLEIEYSSGLSLTQKHSLRNTYRDFVGLRCVFSIGPDVELWAVDADVYNSYCQECVDANKCCRTEVIEEEEDDIEKVALIKIIN